MKATIQKPPAGKPPAGKPPDGHSVNMAIRLELHGKIVKMAAEKGLTVSEIINRIVSS
ncbi:MAG: hypothetical protein NTX27_20755 [Verrucomicrobia bacterium]|nr:hypothetical protein [Verrucomicrobiota bacterium]